MTNTLIFILFFFSHFGSRHHLVSSQDPPIPPRPQPRPERELKRDQGLAKHRTSCLTGSHLFINPQDKNEIAQREDRSTKQGCRVLMSSSYLSTYPNSFINSLVLSYPPLLLKNLLCCFRDNMSAEEKKKKSQQNAVSLNKSIYPCFTSDRKGSLVH